MSSSQLYNDVISWYSKHMDKQQISILLKQLYDYHYYLMLFSIFPYYYNASYSNYRKIDLLTIRLSNMLIIVIYSQANC